MMRSERTQVVGHLAEFTDNRCIPEIAGGRIACPAKGKRTADSRELRENDVRRAGRLALSKQLAHARNDAQAMLDSKAHLLADQLPQAHR